ncbi:MAG: hypothetical protein FOGNACKC_04952 [Anaerolineae bacterium]|nr:hypothetical protein [Anaerolineae bacterium]
MLAAWILGSLFFVFIFAFILYVLTRTVPEPAQARPELNLTLEANSGPDSAAENKQRIFRAYQVIFSPQVFVHYPFGLRVVIAEEGVTTAHVALGLNGRHHFEESYYYNWPQVAQNDPQLIVHNGHFEVDAEDPEAAIRVELQFAGDSFLEPPPTQEQPVRRDSKTEFSFWLTPLKAQKCLLSIVISSATKVSTDGCEKAFTGVNNRPEFEPITIQLAVTVTDFPIRLR